MRPRNRFRTRGGRPAGRGRCRSARLALLLAFAGVGARAEGQYLAVFVDGRILHVTGARLVDTRSLRLTLPDGGSIDVPVTRVDRVIDDAVEPKPEPMPTPAPSCTADFVDAPLPPGTPFAADILEAGRVANLAPRLVAAVVGAESNWNPYAVSRVGAAGLMQLMPAVWMTQGLPTPYDPRSNILAGCRHLRALVERFHDLALALAAYNAGAAVVEQTGGVPRYRETRSFVRRVLGRFCPAAAAGEPAR